MAFDEVRYPTAIENGIIGGPIFSTSVIQAASGKEQRNQNWQFERGFWDLSQAVQDQSELDVLKTFFYARQGSTRGFRFKDWLDYKQRMESTDKMVFGQIQVSGTVYQLSKQYFDAGDGTYVRPIFKPVEGTISIWDNAVLQTEGVDYTIDYATGLVTFSGSPAGTTEWTGEFDVPVRFTIDEMAHSIDLYQTYSWGQIGMMEVRPEASPGWTVLPSAPSATFHDIQLPADVANAAQPVFGATGGPAFRSTAFQASGGAEVRVQRLASNHSSGRWNISHAMLDFSAAVTLHKFFRARRGSAYGFRFRDWSDYKHDMTDTAGTANHNWGFGDGTTGPYQIQKKYESGSGSFNRFIRKPVSGTVQIYKNDAPVGATIDYTDGTFTLGASAGPGDELGWTGDFDVAARFGADEMMMTRDAYGWHTWSNILIKEIQV